jgi:hypothetical protein
MLIGLVWLHILTVILLFGGTALMFLLIGPAIQAVGPPSQPLLSQIAVRSHRYYGIVGGLVILSGLALSWIEGRFSSPLIWTVIVLAFFLAFWGSRVTGARADALASASADSWPAAQARLIQAGTIEFGVYVITFTLMVLVRFGYG